MSTQRLNKDAKRKILSLVLEKTLWPRKVELLVQEGKLAREARALSFNGQISEVEKAIESARKAIENINALTNAHLSLSTNRVEAQEISVNVNGMSFTLRFYGAKDSLEYHRITDYNTIEFSADVKYLATAGARFHGAGLLVIQDEKLKKAIFDHAEQKEALDKEIVEVCMTINAILNKCSTVKKLIEMWPESEQYIPDQLSTKALDMNLPISIEDLNQKLRLAEAA